MWPFERKTEPATEPELRAKLKELEERIEAIDVEWSEWYDKYRRLYARIAKRVERDSESREDAPQSTERHQPERNGALPRPRSLRGF